MTEREAYIAFNMVQDVGWTRMNELAARAGGCAADAYESLAPADRVDWRGRDPDWRAELVRAERMHVAIVTPADTAYPESLRDLASPPLALYVFGDPAALASTAVSLVGSRASTPYGTETAERLAGGLARAGWCVVSGLAAGIDAAAHRGALDADGVTVGVLGGALDEFFPAENRALARRMAEHRGAVVSEFPFGRKPDRTTFPQRNRIVAALGAGTVAVECPERSGTLITVNFAADLGRAVMAVPGRIDRPTSAGCNRLIREGARLVATADDVIEELTSLTGRPDPHPRRVAARSARQARPAPGAAAPPPAVRPRRPVAPPETKTSPDEAKVLAALGRDPVSVDSLVPRTGLPAARVNALLMQLRLKRKVRLCPGNRASLA